MYTWEPYQPERPSRLANFLRSSDWPGHHPKARSRAAYKHYYSCCSCGSHTSHSYSFADDLGIGHDIPHRHHRTELRQLTLSRQQIVIARAHAYHTAVTKHRAASETTAATTTGAVTAMAEDDNHSHCIDHGNCENHCGCGDQLQQQAQSPCMTKEL